MVSRRIIWCGLLMMMTIGMAAAASIPDSVVVLMAKGDSCRLNWNYNNALQYFQRAYSCPLVEKDVSMKTQLLERIMRTHDVLKHWKEMPETSYRLYTFAKEHGDSMHTAMALLMRGKRLHALGQKQEGIQVVLHAIEMMKHTDYVHKNHEVANFYGILAKMYCTDGRYDEALRISQEHERYVNMSKECHSQEWHHRNFLRVYIIRLEILSKMGRLEEADRIYANNAITPFTDPICGNALLVYYRQRGLNAEAMQFLEAARKNICEDGDTIGRNMQRLMDEMGDCYYAMGEYRRAAECYVVTSRIADTLAARSLNDLSDEVHRVIDNERTIAKHHERLTIIIACILMLAVVFLLMLRQTLAIRLKNRQMTDTVRRLMHYRNIVIENGNSVEMDENEVGNVTIEELSRFKEVDKRIMKERLFTNPSFGRDDLVRLFCVDKNTLPTLLQNLVGTNVSGYINTKRMEYAVFLMRKHPEYTLGAISEECGIKSPATFIRNFKNVYGMTPSEFRKFLEDA